MATLTYHPGRVDISTPFNQLFIDHLKSEIPGPYRAWDPEYRLWKVYGRFVSEARRITLVHYATVTEVNPENRDQPGPREDPFRQRRSEYSGRASDETGDEDLFTRARRNWRDSQQAASDRAATRAASGDHAVLGVMPDAPIEVIEAAYRALAKKHHPDRGTGDTAKMQEINQAYARIKRAMPV